MHDAMKRRFCMSFWLLSLVLIGAGCGYLIEDVIDPLPTDRQLADGFSRRRESLEKIRDFFAKNQAVTYMCCSSFCFRRSDDLDDNAHEDVCRTLKVLDSDRADRRLRDEKEVIFIPIAGRYLGRHEDGGGLSDEKGYAYCSSSPVPILETLDTWGTPGHEAFRPLSDYWHLYYRQTYSKPE